MSRFGSEAILAIAFLAGYAAIFLWMSWKYYTKALKWRSRYSLLYFHVIVRIASQACGVAFGINGFSNMGVFLAYLILGAEGYFTLVLCAYRFLISWHEHNHPSHKSWLETTEMFTSPKARRPLIRATVWLMAGILTPFLDYYTPIFIIHCILLLGNTLIITGGSFVANSTKEGADERKVAKNAIISKALRTSGQSFFLGVNVLLFFAIAWTIFSARQKRQGASDGARRRIHPTLILLSVAWIPLMIRGIFGVLQAAVFRLSYNNKTNYNKHGMKPHFLAMEYGLGVATEWVACIILNATYYTSKDDPPKTRIAETYGEENELQAMPEARVSGGDTVTARDSDSVASPPRPEGSTLNLVSGTKTEA